MAPLTSTAAAAGHGRLAAVAALFLLAGAAVTAAQDRPVVELALCLDTSGSMNDSLDEARFHLWGIVDDLSRLEPVPHLRVALLSYGDVDNPKEEGWIRVERPLTGDLDAVSGSLAGLDTGGSEEYVRRVIRVAMDQLDWSEADNAIRMIVVIGNEEANQDPEIDADALADEAERRGIAIHPVYVGHPAGGNYGTWLALGEALGVRVAHLQPGSGQRPAGPADEQLAALGRELSATFVPFGEGGAAAAENQALQDEHAEELGLAAAAGRAIGKAGSLYRPGWDLVDAVESGRVVLDDIPEDNLPPALHGMTPAERDEHLFRMSVERSRLKDRILELRSQRDDHLEAGRKAGLVKDDLRSLVRRRVLDRAEEQGVDLRVRSPKR